MATKLQKARLANSASKQPSVIAANNAYNQSRVVHKPEGGETEAARVARTQRNVQAAAGHLAPGQTPAQVSQNKGQIIKDGHIVKDYGYGAQAEANAARYISSKGQSFGPINYSTGNAVPNGAPIGKQYYGSPVSSAPSVKISNPISWNSQYASGSTSTAPVAPDATGGTTEAPGGYTGGSTGARPVLDGSQYQTAMPEQPRSLAEIRADQLSQAQSAIDATQALFAEQQRQINVTGASQLAQTSSNNVGAGLAGSPFAQTNEAGVQQNTQYQLNAQAAQRSADISGIMQQAEANAQNLYQQGVENYRSDRDFAIGERDTAYSNARLEASDARQAEEDAQAKQDAVKKASQDTILNLAKSGYSLDEMNPEEYKALLANSGMTDFEARAIWAASSPAANASYTTQNGFIVGTYFDPHTGKPVVTTTKLPDSLAEAVNPDIQAISLADGSVVLYDAASPYKADGTLNTINYSGSGIKDAVEGDGLGYDAPTVKTFGGQDYQWDESIGDWKAVEVPGSGLSEQAKKAQNILDIITSLKSDDSVLGNAVGPISSKLPTLRGETADFEEKLKTLQSLLTLENIGLLKGVLSDTDMKILQSAGSSLSLRMSEDGFRAELDKIASKLSGAVGSASSADAGFSAFSPDAGVVNALTNKVKVDIQGNPLEEGEIDAIARYATKLYQEGKSPQEVTDSLNAILRGETPSDFSSVGGDTQKADISSAVRSSKVTVRGDIQPALTSSTVKLGNKTVTVNSAVADRLAMADRDYFAATGKHLPVSESFRSAERQQELYKKLSAKGARVAPQGYSFHELGMAVDVGNAWKEVKPYMNKYGFINGLANDMGHFSVGELS